jgi:hypothetical protein
MRGDTISVKVTDSKGNTQTGVIFWGGNQR